MLAGRDRTGLAEVLGLELRNVVANYPFERSHRFVGIQPNSGHRDYSRVSCDIEDTQLLPVPGSHQRCFARTLATKR